MIHRLAVLVAFGVLLWPPGAGARRPARDVYCSGAYANDLAVLAAHVRKQEARTRYTFCLRSAAVYECLYFGPSGKIRYRRETTASHGTAFAFRRSGTHTYFLTNEHLTDWPFVTSAADAVDGVPSGCRRVSQTLSIVDKEDDGYAKDDIPLQRVLADTALDVSVLKAPVQVAVIPFAFGQSTALQVGNAVQVRGFPLGALQTVSVGRVINPREHDTEGQWDHYDFVTDAQLSTGNSGSPVLAISCKTQRFELVGVYHAAYKEGQSLNVVVGIDEFRELMTTLKPRKKRPRGQPEPTAADRRTLLDQIRRQAITPVFPYGGHVVGLRVAGDRLLYDIYPRSFPMGDWRLAVLEEVPAPGFGRLGRLWFGNEQGLAERAFSTLKPDEQHRVASLLRSLRRYVFAVLRYRKLEPEAKRTRLAHEQLQALKRGLDREDAERRFTVKALVELAGRHAPGPNQTGQPVGVTTTPPAGSATKVEGRKAKP